LFDILFNGKSKELMRKKTIAIFLDNFIKKSYGAHFDEWGPNWRKKSLYEVVSFFKDKEEDNNYKSRLEAISLERCRALEEEHITVEEIYKVLHCTYFNREPSNSEIQRLANEYNTDMFFRGLRNSSFRMVSGKYLPFELQ